MEFLVYFFARMDASSNNIILRFDHATFGYNDGEKIIIDDASFSVRENTKVTIMWQNWAWKSTIFKLIMWELSLQSGKINIWQWIKIAISRQVIPREKMELSVREWYEETLHEKDYSFDKKITDTLTKLHFVPPLDKKLKDFSGWQQARLLLGYALVQEPDILLVDEPTNNLDSDWIWDLISFLLMYEKTVVVISHDADFLNMFTDWVLYLNIMTKNVEQFWWDYYSVQDQIVAQIEKEEKQNARAIKQIKNAKEKIGEFAQKWWKMRKLAKKMRSQVEEAEDDLVEVRRDDKTIRTFTIPFENYIWPIVEINRISLMDKNQNIRNIDVDISIKKKERYILSWPNGIGKTTLLKSLLGDENTTVTSTQATIKDDVRIWYYSQDFAALDMSMIVRDALHASSDTLTDQEVYKVAAGFLLTWDLLKKSIGFLSEGQKWLLCYARFVLQKPHILIMDEPTNHINFRHLPIIAEALNAYEWAMLIISHDQEFVRQLQQLEEIDLWRFIK